MILTNCAACAAPLAHDAPRCVRCWTRYCNATCQHDHWRRGHKQICKKIHRAGGAEQYHADKKYKEAVAVAVEACRGRHEDQKCYICLEAVHTHTGEGLVRGCACGDRDGVKSPELGVAHVSCLARQAKESVREAEENRLDQREIAKRFNRWHTCSLCEQDYHGVVRCALGWACWKTYVGRPETHQARRLAMTQLGNGLSAARRHEEELSVAEAELSTLRRLGAPENTILVALGNLAKTYDDLGRHEDALRMKRDVYFGYSRMIGEEDVISLQFASNYAISLIRLKRFEEAKSLMRKTLPVARRVLDGRDDTTFRMSWIYAEALLKDGGGTLDDLREAVEMLENTEPTARRVLGGAHPLVEVCEQYLEDARAALRAREAETAA